jgi:hypothetical protein
MVEAKAVWRNPATTALAVAGITSAFFRCAGENQHQQPDSVHYQTR